MSSTSERSPPAEKTPCRAGDDDHARLRIGVHHGPDLGELQCRRALAAFSTSGRLIVTRSTPFGLDSNVRCLKSA